MSFILLLMVWLNGQGVTVTTVEYRSKEACEAAGTAAVKEFTIGPLQGRYVCTNKFPE